MLKDDKAARREAMREPVNRIQTHIRAVEAKYPRAWEQLAMFRAERGSNNFPLWPGWCYVPLAGAYAIVSGGGDNRVIPGQQTADVGRVAALGAWRLSRGIYRFHPEMFRAVWETEMGDRLPVEHLYALPEFCVYLLFPELMPLFGFSTHGVFVHLEHDVNSGEPELRLLLDTDVAGITPIALHLASASIQENIRETEEYTMRQAKRAGDLPTGFVHPPVLDAMRESWERVISLVLYLCSVNLEIRDAAGKKSAPRRPGPVKTKKGWRIFPADATTFWEVGYETGENLARECEVSERGPMGERWSPRPHIRRAHWHSFWTGPRTGARKLVVKWLHPILVGK